MTASWIEKQYLLFQSAQMKYNEILYSRLGEKIDIQLSQLISLFEMYFKYSNEEVNNLWQDLKTIKQIYEKEVYGFFEVEGTNGKLKKAGYRLTQETFEKVLRKITEIRNKMLFR